MLKFYHDVFFPLDSFQVFSKTVNTAGNGYTTGWFREYAWFNLNRLCYATITDTFQKFSHQIPQQKVFLMLQVSCGLAEGVAHHSLSGKKANGDFISSHVSMTARKEKGRHWIVHWLWKFLLEMAHATIHNWLTKVAPMAVSNLKRVAKCSPTQKKNSTLANILVINTTPL